MQQLSNYTGFHCKQCGAPDWTSSEPGFRLTTPEGTSWVCDSCAAAEAPTCDVCGEPIWPAQRERAVSITRDGHELALVHAGCEPTHLLRCAWEAWNEYGGPEEGGWHFEAGRLLAAVPVPLEVARDVTARAPSTTALEAADALLQSAFGALETRTTRLKFTLEADLPEASFPLQRPHYE